MAGMADESTNDLADQLAATGARIDPVLEELIPRTANDYLSDPVWHHLDSGGKRIRPAICVLTCERLGGRGDDALYFAAAVEIMHNMFLVHDDLEDGDTVRRDRPTVWVAFGVPSAVNVGDYLLGIGLDAVLKTPAADRELTRLMKAYVAAFINTCRGQALDMNLRGAEVTVEDYLRMVTLKTGRYLALGMVGGAILSGADDEAVEALGELGENMGPAFQIRDDTIDLTIGKGRGGVTGNDIREGKPSILYAHALSQADEEQGEFLTSVMAKSREETTDADVARVAELYELLGSFEFARSEADRLVGRAYETIDRLPVRDKDFFHQLTRYMVDRTT
jgi:geranylgeranyl pyrophosphate synthase